MDASSGKTMFFTCVGPGQVDAARLLIESIRAFGGPLSECPVWVLEADPAGAPCGALAGDRVSLRSVEVRDSLGGYLFARKVSACAAAEEYAAGEFDSLIWLIPECLIVGPPVLFELNASCDAAVRPVHIRNVGLPVSEKPDAFWRGVYDEVGEPASELSVESFIGEERFRPYYNSAAMSVRPSLGLFRRWLEHFEVLVCDRGFQERACADERHRIFLHQAVLSALIATAVEPDRVRELPPDYGYPYNLHDTVADARRVDAMDDLVCAIYEQRPVDPSLADDIGMSDGLIEWLEAHFRSRR